MPQGIEEAPGVDGGRLHDIGRLGVRRSVFVAADASTNTTTNEETDATAIHRPARARLRAIAERPPAKANPTPGATGRRARAAGGDVVTRTTDNANERTTGMGRIVISENISLDGVIQDPAGDEGFARGGWVGRIAALPELAKVTLDEALGTEALLLGRRSYEWLAARWPSRTGELADRLNGLPKYVVSSTLETPDWNNSTVLKGDVVDAVSKLKQELSGEINVPASFQLVRTLIEHDLVDELRLKVFPVVLGAGERLFGETSDKKAMRLLDTQTVGDGIAILTYERVRAAERAPDGASPQDKRAAALRRTGTRETA
jgi:dihydrofolate reductase